MTRHDLEFFTDACAGPTLSPKTIWRTDQPTPAFYQNIDLARTLSQINRYNGHTSRPYSVAEHSILVAALLPQRLCRLGLLHDAGEAATGDTTRPWLKTIGQTSPRYHDLHAAWHDAALKAFDLHPTDADRAALAHADGIALELEAAALLSQQIGAYPLPTYLPLDLGGIPTEPTYWAKAYTNALLATSLYDRHPLEGYFNLWKKLLFIDELHELRAWFATHYGSGERE